MRWARDGRSNAELNRMSHRLHRPGSRCSAGGPTGGGEAGVLSAQPPDLRDLGRIRGRDFDGQRIATWADFDAASIERARIGDRNTSCPRVGLEASQSHPRDQSLDPGSGREVQSKVASNVLGAVDRAEEGTLVFRKPRRPKPSRSQTRSARSARGRDDCR